MNMPIAQPFTNFPAKKTGEETATTSRVMPMTENRKAVAKENLRPILSAIQPAARDPMTALWGVREKRNWQTRLLTRQRDLR